MSSKLPISNQTLAIRSAADLAVLGINPLTGEACAYSQRILCDVNEEGRELLREYLGLPSLELAPAMNGTVDGWPAVGCFMLSRGSIQDLARFGMFYKGALANITFTDGTLYGLFDQDLVDRYAGALSNGTLERNPVATSCAPRVGSRNVHQMTGRVL